jgi:hypothetical protein
MYLGFKPFMETLKEKIQAFKFTSILGITMKVFNYANGERERVLPNFKIEDFF